MRARSALLVSFLALSGCDHKAPSSGSATQRWFDAHKAALLTTRDMLAADHGLVTSISLSPLRQLRGASGANGSCSSAVRSGDFPWQCTGGIAGKDDTHAVAKDARAVEDLLGLGPGRLQAYALVLPASVSVAGSCAPAGSMKLWLADSDAPTPCTGVDNIIWSDKAPAPDEEPACRTTVALAYLPLGNGFYDESCATTGPSTSGSSTSAPALDSGAVYEDAVRTIVARWSDALDRHQITELADLYASRVDFYGRDLPRSAVLLAKRHALGPTSTFHQTLVGTIAVTRDGDAFTARVLKRSGSGGVLRDVKARLVIADGHIRAESDDAADDHATDQKRKACVELAATTVQALPAVKKLLDGDAKLLGSAHDGRTMGGLGPIDEEDGGFSASLGVNHPERFESQVWYTVDAKGRLGVTSMGEDLVIPPAAARAVERACALADAGP